MINFTELNQGNYISDLNGKILYFIMLKEFENVQSIECPSNTGKFTIHSYSDLKGIELNNDWLKKFGGNEINKNRIDFKVYTDTFQCHYSFQNKFWNITRIDQYGQDKIFSNQIKFVHQFQQFWARETETHLDFVKYSPETQENSKAGLVKEFPKSMLPLLELDKYSKPEYHEFGVDFWYGNILCDSYNKDRLRVMENKLNQSTPFEFKTLDDLFTTIYGIAIGFIEFGESNGFIVDTLLRRIIPENNQAAFLYVGQTFDKCYKVNNLEDDQQKGVPLSEKSKDFLALNGFIH